MLHYNCIRVSTAGCWYLKSISLASPDQTRRSFYTPHLTAERQQWSLLPQLQGCSCAATAPGHWLVVAAWWLCHTWRPFLAGPPTHCLHFTHHILGSSWHEISDGANRPKHTPFTRTSQAHAAVHTLCNVFTGHWLVSVVSLDANQLGNCTCYVDVVDPDRACCEWPHPHREMWRHLASASLTLRQNWIEYNPQSLLCRSSSCVFSLLRRMMKKCVTNHKTL